MLGNTPRRPEAGTPIPGTRHPSAQCILGDTGNKWVVRMLLECNLVALHLYVMLNCRFIKQYLCDKNSDFQIEIQADLY